MRIPIEFTGGTHPFTRRERMAPRSRRSTRPHAAGPWDGVRPDAPEARPEPLRAVEEPLSRSYQPEAENPGPCKPDPVPSSMEHEPEAACEPPAVVSEEEETWRDRYLRLKVDMENVRRHAEADRVRLSAQGKDAVLEDLFPILDNLQRAIRAAQGSGRDSGILKGIEMVHSELLGVLEKHGVERIQAVGRPFDPSLHEAVAVRQHPDHEKDTVLEELRNGFARGNVLLRPASVIVAA